MISTLRYVVLISLVFSLSAVTAQWTQIGNSYNSSTDNNQLAVKGDTLFMGVKVSGASPSLVYYTLLSSANPSFAEYDTWGIVDDIEDAAIWHGEFLSILTSGRLTGIEYWYMAPFRHWHYISSNPNWYLDNSKLQVHNDTIYLIGNNYDINVGKTHVEVKKFDGTSWSSLGVTTNEIGNKYANLIFVNDVPHISFSTWQGNAVVLKSQAGQWIPVGPDSVVEYGSAAAKVAYMNNKLHMIYEDTDDFYATKLMIFENGVWTYGPTPYYSSDVLKTYNNNLYLNSEGEILQRYDGVSWTEVGGSSTGYSAGYQKKFDFYVDQDGSAYMSFTEDSPSKSILLKYDCTTTTDTRTETACNSYTSPSGRYVWTQSGTYFDTISNNVGCNLALTINVTINTLDTTVTRSGFVLTANATNVSYQWFDCSTGNAIPGATSSSYTVTASGTYKCEITDANCTVSTTCQNVYLTGVTDMNNAYVVNVFPNPAKSNLNIEVDYDGAIEYAVLDVTGKQMLTGILNDKSETIDISVLHSGQYILKLNSDQFTVVKSVIKK